MQSILLLVGAVCAESRFTFFFFSPTRKNTDAEEKTVQECNVNGIRCAFRYPSVLKRCLGYGGTVSTRTDVRTSRIRRTIIL